MHGFNSFVYESPATYRFISSRMFDDLSLLSCIVPMNRRQISNKGKWLESKRVRPYKGSKKAKRTTRRAK